MFKRGRGSSPRSGRKNALQRLYRLVPEHDRENVVIDEFFHSLRRFGGAARRDLALEVISWLTSYSRRKARACSGCGTKTTAERYPRRLGAKTESSWLVGPWPKDSNRFPLDVGKGRWFHGKGRTSRKAAGAGGHRRARIAPISTFTAGPKQAVEELSFCHSERCLRSEESAFSLAFCAKEIPRFARDDNELWFFRSL